ncbi:MAG: YciI family protein [Polyangiaceae bacterium]
MNKYLFLYWNPPAPDRQPSPEEMQQMLEQWQSWKEKFKKQVVDMGDGLDHDGRVLKDGKVTDGPYAEAKEIVGGFSIIEAESFDHALEVARACPITYMPGASIEIRKMMGF